MSDLFWPGDERADGRAGRRSDADRHGARRAGLARRPGRDRHRATRRGRLQPRRRRQRRRRRRDLPAGRGHGQPGRAAGHPPARAHRRRGLTLAAPRPDQPGRRRHRPGPPAPRRPGPPGPRAPGPAAPTGGPRDAAPGRSGRRSHPDPARGAGDGGGPARHLDHVGGRRVDGSRPRAQRPHPAGRRCRRHAGRDRRAGRVPRRRTSSGRPHGSFARPPHVLAVAHGSLTDDPGRRRAGRRAPTRGDGSRPTSPRSRAPRSARWPRARPAVRRRCRRSATPCSRSCCAGRR